MILRRFFLLSLLLVAGLTGCKKNNGTTPAPTTASQTDLLVANNWLLSRVSTPDGQSISTNRLNLATQVLYQLDMQFRKDNTVRAIDHTSKQIINGGTWTLATDSKSIDVVVTGFNGNFPLVDLSRTKLVLRQRAPVDGKTADINLEFAPSL